MPMLDASKASEAASSAKLPEVTEQVLQAQARQQAMLQSNVGYNISPSSWDKYGTLGRDGTFLSGQHGVMKYFGDVQGSETTISKVQAGQIEQEMGLSPGSLQDGFKVRQVAGLTDMAPRSPLAGNEFFRGPGMHLPGGVPEMVVDPIPTADNAGGEISL